MKFKSIYALTIAIQIGLIPVVGLSQGQRASGAPPTPVADATGINKSRFISFSVPGGAATAIRIRLVSLHHAAPAYTGGPTIPFTAFEGQTVYVGAPQTYCEAGSVSAGCISPFFASITQCAPHYQDWGPVGLVHVTGSAIGPSSIYHAENLSAACMGVEGTAPCLPGGAEVSAALIINTTRWADVQTAFNPPAVTTQPDARDFSALLKKFIIPAGQPIKARALLFGDAFGRITTSLNVNVGFNELSVFVDAFAGKPYPFKMGKCTGPPAAGFTGACTTTAECTGPAANGAGPCVLLKVGNCTGPRASGNSGTCIRDSDCTAGTNGAPPCILACP